MRIFVYEFVVGGGLLSDDLRSSVPSSIIREGRAMLDALVADFASLNHVEVHTLVDGRSRANAAADCFVHQVRTCAEEQSAFREQAAAADWTVLLAPEFDDLLLSRCRSVQRAGGRLLGADPELVQLTADKQLTAEHLERAGVPTPAGRALAAGDELPCDFDYPAVLKPRNGAGSIEICIVDSHQTASSIACDERRRVRRASRLESYVPGLPVSVAFLCGPAGHLALPPCHQTLSVDGRFRYLGGSFPLEKLLARRATRLSARAIRTLTEPLGYVGVDMILGDAPDGSGDVIVEINPRVTTSYVGLRDGCRQNLAAAMLQVAEGGSPPLNFDSVQRDFDAAGRVRERECPKPAKELPCG